jgi:hypothetical protein
MQAIGRDILSQTDNVRGYEDKNTINW